MKSVSSSFGWKSGVVFPVVGLVLACATGVGALPEARAQATPPRGSDSLPYTIDKLDEPVQIIKQSEPRYPKALQDSLITARIVLRYIVDATGRAEPNSFQVLEHVETNTDTTHASFVEEAKKTILKSTFKPARYQGRRVRQLVEQKINFKIRP